MNKKTFRKASIVIGTFIAISTSVITTINGKGVVGLFAHSAQLEVLYDSCIPEPYNNDTGDVGDGEDEKWYELIQSWIGNDNIVYHNCNHFPHSNNQISTIKYYINESSKTNPSLTWESFLPSSISDSVKAAIISSMQKWNNIYLYKYSSSNFLIKHRLVNIIEGSYNDNNLTIYPTYPSIFNPYATTEATWDDQSSIHFIDNNGGIDHYHCDKWEMNFNLAFYDPLDVFYNYGVSTLLLNRTGAHELGHVLGLFDIDDCETINSNTSWHHEELLMGYSNGSVLTRQSDITYKDLIGAAITRGLHTDDDHQWIYYSSGHGAYKLVCSICNGVRYISSLDGIDYVDYKDCNDEHDLADGNMFAVASYGNSDYYKCKYCRYVAPFDDIEPQNYSKSQYNSLNHIVTNQVTGLSYSFYESHTYNDHYNNYNLTQHKAYCECGRYTLMPHVADMSRSYTVFGHTYAPCLYCGAAIEIGGNGPIIPIPGSNDLMITDNGSYIMPNGIYVIMEEDLEAFLNGTLVFHPYGEVGE